MTKGIGKSFTEDSKDREFGLTTIRFVAFCRKISFGARHLIIGSPGVAESGQLSGKSGPKAFGAKDSAHYSPPGFAGCPKSKELASCLASSLNTNLSPFPQGRACGVGRGLGDGLGDE